MSLRTLFSRRRPAVEDRQPAAKPAVAMPPLAVAEPLCLIGDVHGCLGLLDRLGRRIADAAPEAHVVLVGDYIDRGDDSAEVLRRLAAATEAGERITCLFGNHEEMLLDFLANPLETGPRWLRYGGLQTLASFGIRGVRETCGDSELREAQIALREAMGEPLIAWLHGLPRMLRSGNLAVVHAGADPGLPIEAQPDGVLTWGHPAFPWPRADGIWIAHGHTIVPAPSFDLGRVALDTGAYATGRLTAALLSPDRAEPHFLVA